MSGYIDDLVRKIIAKASEPDSVIRDVEIRATTLTDSGDLEWSARISPPMRGVPFKFHGAPTVQGAVLALAREVGAL
jgi:hypothetical protein